MPYQVFRTSEGAALGRRNIGAAVAATVYSDPWSCAQGDGFSVHVEWTGTAGGNLQLWYTSNPDADRATDNDWFQDTDWGTAGNVALGGAPGKYGDNAGNAKAKFFRFKLASGTGTGIIRGYVTAPRTC